MHRFLSENNKYPLQETSSKELERKTHMDKLIPLIVNGMMSFSTLLIVSLGMAIICGKMKLFNLAHGELVTVGAYVSYLMLNELHQSFLISILASFTVTFVLGVIIEKVIIKPLYSRSEETLLATFGLSLILQEGMKFLFTSIGKSVSMPVKGSVTIVGSIIPTYNVWVFGITILMFVLTILIFYCTSLGKKIRAIGQNRDMTECLGVNTSFCDTFTFAYGCALTGVAGTLLAPLKSITPTMGTSYLLDSFMTVCVGGADSFLGTVVASLGIEESTSLIGGYTNSVLAKLLVFIIIIVLIRIRPEGIFAKEKR